MRKILLVLSLIGAILIAAQLCLSQVKKLDYVPGELILKFTRQAHTNPLFQIATSDRGVTTGLNSIDQINQRNGVTRITKMIPDAARELVVREAVARGQKTLNTFLEDRYGLHRSYILKIATDAKEAAKAFESDPNVEYAVPNYIIEANAIPNDEFYSTQWNFPKIQAPSAWDISTGSTQIKIGIIDSGVDLYHPDLMGNLYQGYDFVSKIQWH